MNWRKSYVAGALSLLSGCGATDRDAPSAPQSTLFAQAWNSGLSRDEPAFQSQALDADTFVIRQSIHTTFEAPFLYLLFGKDRALLIDTGVEGAPLRPEVDRLIAAWLAANSREAIPLVVMHSHGHGDHVGGDAGFANRPETVVIGHSAAEVASFFGIADWPADISAYDLGERVVDILPTPGHHASHVMVFDRATRIMFSGDAVYPGRLYFQCENLATYKASIDRVAVFGARRNVRWLLGGHIEMKARPKELFNADDRSRRGEHALELAPSVLSDIQDALAAMGDAPRVESHDSFVLFPHPADPRGKKPPDWCLTERAGG
jgi:glyoxylase-like metal-dependent hydrolase (beta-lactamase superfamily II)